MSRHLITTADERSWKFDRPVLFLGEWCRLYDRKQVWECMDAAIAEPYGLQAGQKERDLAYVQALSSRLLQEVADALNAYHNTYHSLRYWHIVLGRWLQRYVAVIFNRYFTLEQVLHEYDVSGSTVYESSGYSLATTDSDTFTWACNDDVWNHVLYSKILNYWGYIKTELDAGPLRGITGFSQEREWRTARGPHVKRLVVDVANNILPRFSRKHDALIINSYLPKKEEVKLQISLRQCPQLWRSPRLKAVAPDPNPRQRLSIDAANHEGFERFVRTQLPELIPTCYVEGYGELVRQVKSLPWPPEPKFIFTSNNFDTDEIFKAWTGSKVEEGVPYFAGQHGNNYGTLLGSQNWPELVTCDRFFTWGWTNGSPRNIPAFVLKTAGCKQKCRAPSGGLLLIEVCVPHRISSWDGYFEFGIYQEEQFRFVAALPAAIQQKLTVRFHSEYRKHKWSDEQRWRDRSPHTRIETGASNIWDLIGQSRLVVHSYDSTGILEALALNIPMLCFWHGGLDHLLPSAKPYYELLRSAGILADTPEQAGQLVALRWDNVSEWWLSKKVQDARKSFCEQYARTENHPIRTIKQLLRTHANEKRE